MKTYCLALDLVNDPLLIKEYEQYHQKIWPEISASIRNSGIRGMRIFRVENRLMMIMTVEDDFSFEKKNAMDSGNAKVLEWEQLMWKYQSALPGSKPGEKWRLMNLIFDLDVNG
ncbi:MAG TPA: L-rhamnose mutarotase [Chryseosolibacter sp.]|nr:L-rhamnose mutarotase [Chryseosolibacter sp.]